MTIIEAGPMRAAIYARKSTEDARNPGKSIADQLRESRVEVGRRGWQLDEVHVYEDSGISASRYARGKRRPGFDALVESIEAGAVDVVVLAEMSRASRRLSEIGRVLELCAETGTMLVIGGRDVDPTNPTDVLLASVESGMAAGESERLSKRALRGARGTAQEGKPAGKNLLGYRRFYHDTTKALVAVEPVPEEAAIVREIASRLLRGDSLREIAGDLNARSVPSPYDFVAARQGREPKEAPWVGEQVRRVALNPAYAGLRRHHPEKHDKRKATVPTLTDAVWPAIITRAEHERLVAMLTNPKRRTNGAVRPGAVVHWLSGVAVCGECGKPLRVLTNRGKYRTYTCVQPGCMKVSRTAGPIEEYVEEVVFALVERPELLSAIGGQSGDEVAVAAVEHLDELCRRRDAVRASIVDGTMQPADGAAILTPLSDEIAKAEEHLRVVSLPRQVADLDLDDLRSRWTSMTPARKRAIADALVRVTVLSMHGRKARRFDPATVDVTPRYA